MRQGERLVNKKGTYHVKFLTENQTKRVCAAYTRVGNGTENTYAYYCQRERLQGILLTANGNNIMATQNNLPLTARFQLVENTLNGVTTCGERRECGEV